MTAPAAPGTLPQGLPQSLPQSLPPSLSQAPRATPLRHAEHVMGTVFSFAVRDPGPGGRRAVEAALRRAVRRLHRIDETFSPYWRDSPVSRLARAEITLADCDPEVAEVLDRCQEVAEETGGWFTAHPGGRLDPSGWVKGWAVDEAVRTLREAGAGDLCVSGGGDVRCVGGPWRVGIAHPGRPAALTAVVAGHDLAVATSGTGERGPHIIDPHTGRPAGGLLSLTLVGRSPLTLARTDAWATAAFAMGPERGLAWAETRPGVEALAVLPDGRKRWTSGFPALVAPTPVSVAVGAGHAAAPPATEGGRGSRTV